MQPISVLGQLVSLVPPVNTLTCDFDLVTPETEDGSRPGQPRYSLPEPDKSRNRKFAYGVRFGLSPYEAPFRLSNRRLTLAFNQKVYTLVDGFRSLLNGYETNYLVSDPNNP